MSVGKKKPRIFVFHKNTIFLHMGADLFMNLDGSGTTRKFQKAHIKTSKDRRMIWAGGEKEKTTMIV